MPVVRQSWPPEQRAQRPAPPNFFEIYIWRHNLKAVSPPAGINSDKEDILATSGRGRGGGRLIPAHYQTMGKRQDLPFRERNIRAVGED